MVLALADVRPTDATIAATAPAGLSDFLVNGCYVPPADLSLDTWVSHGQALTRRWARLLWLVADWARVGVDYFGPAAWNHLAAVAGRDRDTLRKMVATSRRFPPQRRRLGIPFSRHVAVATLPEKVADELLVRAEREGWAQQDLYRHVRAYRGQPTKPKAKRRTRRSALAGPSTTTPLVVPSAPASGDAVPVKCSGCRLTVGYSVNTIAVVSNGPAAVQRISSGQLTMNVECPHCESTTLVSLGALEIPASAALAAGIG